MNNYMKTILSALKIYIDKIAARIPTKISQLENDDMYYTEIEIDNKLNDIQTTITESTSDVITIDGGATTSTLADIFGEPPYTIEFTEETEELYNVTVASGNDFDTYRIRNIAVVTEVPTTMNDGDIALVIRKEG